MAVIPIHIARVQPLETGSVVHYPTDSPVGRALEGAGRTLVSVASKFQNQQDAIAEKARRDQEQLDNFKETRAAALLPELLSSDLQSAQQNMSGDGTGTHDSLAGQFDPIANTVTKPGLFDERAAAIRDTLPESVREKFDARLPALRTQFSRQAAATEFEQRSRFYDSEIKSGLEKLALGAMQADTGDPATFELFLKQGEDLINASGLPDYDKGFGSATVRGKARRIHEWRAHASEVLFQSRDPAEQKRIVDSWFGRSEVAAPNATTVTVTPQDYFGADVDVSSLPGGMRNNNPGNLKYSSRSTSLFNGVAGPSENTDQGDPQIVFDSPQAGMNAAAQLALRKFNGGKTTVDQIIAGKGGWTPGNHKAAENVAASMGVAVDQQLDFSDQDQLGSFLRGLVKQEHGRSSGLYDEALFQEAVHQAPTGVNRGQGPTVEAAAKIPPAGSEAAMAKTFLAGVLTADKDQSHIEGLSDQFSSRLAAMIQAAPDSVKIFSGARSIEHQKRLHDEAIAKYGRDDLPGHQVAKPGKSQHNHGNAADLKYGSPAARKWVHENAARFGLTFPVTGEPWHIEPAEARQGGMPAGQAIDDAGPVGSPQEDPRFRYLPADRRIILARSARTAADAVAASEKVEVSSLVDDDLASMEEAGVGVPDLTPERVAAALGEQKAIEWANEREAAASRFAAMDGMEEQPSEALSARLSELQPVPGMPGYDKALDTYEAAEKRAADIQEKRFKDPAESVATLPEVVAAREAFDGRTPETSMASWQQLLRARISAQDRIGIAPGMRLPLTDAEADEFAAPIKNAAMLGDAAPGQSWFEMVEDMSKAFKAAGEYSDEVFRQVVGKLIGGEDKDDKARHAANLIKALLADQAAPLADARAMDELDETGRIEDTAKQLSGGTPARGSGLRRGDPAPLAGARKSAPIRQPAGRRIKPYGEPTRQPAEPSRGKSITMLGGKVELRSPVNVDIRPHIRLPTPDEEDIQFLRDNPETIWDFIAIFGDAEIPPDVRTPRRGGPK